MLLSNRVAIITGGAMSIGRVTAVLFTKEGSDGTMADIIVLLMPVTGG